MNYPEGVTVVRWLHGGTGRSRRSSNTRAGIYVLEHEATGRFFMAQSDEVSVQVDKDLSLLAMNKHPCKLLNALYSKDSTIRVLEYPEKKVKQREAMVQQVIRDTEPAYLCLSAPKCQKSRKSKKSNPSNTTKS